MYVKPLSIKFLPINDVILTTGTKKKEIYIILIKKCFIEILKIGSTQKLKNISISNINKNIKGNLILLNKSRGIFDLILLDNHQIVRIIKFSKNLEFKITSSKNLSTLFPLKKKYCIFLAISKNSTVCLLSTTCGNKIFLRIGKNKKNSHIFFKKGIRIAQKSIICFFTVNSDTFSQKIFFSIETVSVSPYSRFLTFYTYKKSGYVKKKIFSRIENSAYLLVSMAKTKKSIEKLIVLSKGKLSIINYLKKIQLSESFPIKKFNDNYFQPPIISYCFFEGKAKIIFFFSTIAGDIFKLNTNMLSDKYTKKLQLKIDYFDTIGGKIKNIGILPNGFFYSILITGQLLFYRFIRIKHNITNKKGFFISHQNAKNMKMVDEVCLISQISSTIDENFFHTQSYPSLFFCGTKNRSCLRLLEKISTIISVFFKPFIFNPIGLFVFEIPGDNVYFLISFKSSTLSFLFEEKIEDTNQLKINSDLKTISVFFSKSLGAMIQITDKTIKLILKKKRDKKICQWIPDSKIFILNSVQNIHGKPYIFLFLSNNKVVLLEFTKKELFLELKSWSIEKFEEGSLLLNCYISNQEEGVKILLLGTKKERTLRIYEILPNCSIILTGIHLLKWSPESISIIKNEENVFFFISLNNGVLLKTIFCSKKKNFKFLEFLNISIYPLYLPDNFSQKNSVVFGEKVWRLKNDWLKPLKVNLVFSKSFDFLEPLGNFIFILKKKKLKILLPGQDTRIFLNKLGFYLDYTVTNSFYLKKQGIKFILTINKNSFCRLNNHGMNLESIVKKIKISSYSGKNELCGSSISILEFFNKPNLTKSQTLRLIDFFFLTVSSGEWFFNSITKKKSFFSDNYIFLLSKVFRNKYIYNTGVISPIIEKFNQIVSIMSILLKNTYKFSSEIGGGYTKTLKFNFLFEENINYQNSRIPSSFLNTNLLGSRIIVCIETKIKIIEIAKEIFKTIHVINIPCLNIKKIQTIGNKIYYLEIFQGLRTLLFKNKSKVSKGLSLFTTFLFCDFFIFNPMEILSIDIFKNSYVLKNNIDKLEYFKKNKNELENLICF